VLEEPLAEHVGRNGADQQHEERRREDAESGHVNRRPVVGAQPLQPGGVEGPDEVVNQAEDPDEGERR
jgi:hypothetical protein